MLLATLSAALLLQGVPAPAELDTLPYDSPATGALVERVIRAGATIPEGLRDYRADFRSSLYLSVRPDSAQGGEVPVTVDEFAGEVRWDRSGAVRQAVQGHRVRMLSPAPYTLGSVLESPWIVPHLYGTTIDVFQLSATPAGTRRVARAIHPFSPRGPDLYRYEAGDTLRVSTGEGLVTLAEVVVRPRAQPDPGRQLVVGSFYVDTDRAAVARARFGFLEPARGLLRLSRTGTFFEMENGLVQGRYWLPYRQRQEVQISSPLFGGAAAIRVVSALSGYDLNTGWTPEGARFALVREPARGDPFRGWREGVGEFDIADFDDLRRMTGAEPGEEEGVRVGFLPERGEHLFRYNRVEGLFLGGAVEVEIPAPDARWEVYGTAGWAFAEEAVRGELAARYLAERPGPPDVAGGWSVSGAAYRRLRDVQAFRPAFRWDLGYALSAALGGYDILDYYDAAGVELVGAVRRGPWSARAGARWEEQDSVRRNTGRFLFGEAERFPPVAPADPGQHAGVEGELRYARGAGAFTLGNSVIASLRAEAGFGTWEFGRVVGLLSGRQSLGPFTLATRVDAGATLGELPAQLLFRVGEAEGLRGYGPNEFGGTAAAVGRGRFLAHLPPYGREPLARFGFFIIPPLRPALVLSGTAAWTEVRDEARDDLQRIGARTTEGLRTSAGVGVSIFEDFLVAEYVRPLEGGEGRWYVGLVQWF